MSVENKPTMDDPHSSSLSELKGIIYIWAISFVWVIGYCLWYGYEANEVIELTFGIPSWAFWGVFVPWAVATVATCWFALTQMKDHPLDVEADDQDAGSADA